MKRFFSLLLFASLLLCLTGCGEKQPEETHIHKWEPANCSRGEFCFSCGETQGEALGHTWVDATCEKAKHCSRCGLTEGASLGGHISNGSGNCSRCGEEVNSVAKIDGQSKLGYYDPRPLVYDGVIFEFPLVGGWPGYPTEFVICDQSGTEVARGNWPKNPPYVLGKNEEGKWIDNRQTRTEFVPLEPGTYIVTFYFYDRARSDTSPDVREDSVYIPAGEFKTGHCTLFVK